MSKCNGSRVTMTVRNDGVKISEWVNWILAYFRCAFRLVKPEDMYLVSKVGDGVKNRYLDIADWYKSLRNHCSKKVVDCNYLAWLADGHRWQLLSYSWMLSCEVRSLAKCLYTMSCPYPPMLKNFPNARFSLWAICESTNTQHHSNISVQLSYTKTTPLQNDAGKTKKCVSRKRSSRWRTRKFSSLLKALF